MIHVIRITIFLLLGISSGQLCQCEKKIDLYLGGFFPIHTDGWNASGLIPASQMAIDDINSRNDILPNHRLNLIIADTKGLATLGLKLLFDFIHLPPAKIMLLGSGFSRVTSAVAGVAKYYNLIQLDQTQQLSNASLLQLGPCRCNRVELSNETTFSSESAAISDKDSFPFLFRTCFSVNTWILPQIIVVKYYNWTRVATITRRSDLYDSSTERLVNELDRANIQVIAKEGFISGTNSSRQIRNLKASYYDNKADARIIIAHLQEEDAIEIFCQAYKYGMYGADYAWIVPSFLSRTFWKKAPNFANVDCTPEEIATAANLSLSVSFAELNVADNDTISGMTPNEFLFRYHNWPSIIDHSYWPNSYAAFAYDAVWVEALAMNNSIDRLAELNKTLEDFQYGDNQTSQILKEEMYNANFSGISNIIQFDQYGDVHPHVTYLVQHQGDVKRKVATILPKNGQIKFYTTPPNIIKWAGQNPPVDHIEIRPVPIKLSVLLYIIMSSLSCLGIILVVAFMIYNNKHRDDRVIKMSSPNLNNCILVGCILLYSSIVTNGSISVVASPVLCMLAPWLTTLGFAIVSGSMFAKTYRAYKILTTRKRIAPIHDYHLYGIVAVLILIETIVLTTWTIIDPMVPRHRKLHTMASPDYHFVILQPIILECHCQHNIIWLATILTVNAFVLIFGGFLAYEARNIRLLIMNESKQIALCIYNVSLLCIIVIPISIFLTNTNGEAYIASSGLILYCTTSSICIFFIPKIKYNRGSVNPAPRRQRSVVEDNIIQAKMGYQHKLI